MRELLLLLAILSIRVFAQQSFLEEYTTSDPKAQEQFRASHCKWGSSRSKMILGFTEMHDQPEPTRVECYALARLAAIVLDKDPTLHESIRQEYRQEFIVLYDDHKGFKEYCHIIPVKPGAYDNITGMDYAMDKYQNDDKLSAEFLRRLNNNVRLECTRLSS